MADSRLLGPKPKSFCGKCRNQRKRIPIGQTRFGRWTLIERQIIDGVPMYLCRCDCGTELHHRHAHLMNIRDGGCRKCYGARKHGPDCHRWTGYGELPGSYWKRLKSNARNRGQEVHITIKEGWELFEAQGGRCALTGMKLTFAKWKAPGDASLDRIDSSKLYEPGNVQWIHKIVNKMKTDLDQETFLFWCKAVAAHVTRTANSGQEEADRNSLAA